MTYVTNFTRKTYAASFRPGNCQMPRGFSPGCNLPQPSGRIYLIGVFNGGSLFPSPRFVTSTHSEAASSYPMI